MPVSRWEPASFVIVCRHHVFLSRDIVQRVRWTESPAVTSIRSACPSGLHFAVTEPVPPGPSGFL
jgi:hypothetical protein